MAGSIALREISSGAKARNHCALNLRGLNPPPPSGWRLPESVERLKACPFKTETEAEQRVETWRKPRTFKTRLRKQLLKQFQLHRQIFLRIGAEGIQQIACIGKRVIQIVIKRLVGEELAHGALALVDALEDGVEVSHGVSHLLGEDRVLSQLAQRALAGVDLAYQFFGAGQRLVQVVVERFVLEQLAGRAFALTELGGDLIQLLNS